MTDIDSDFNFNLIKTYNVKKESLTLYLRNEHNHLFSVDDPVNLFLIRYFTFTLHDIVTIPGVITEDLLLHINIFCEPKEHSEEFVTKLDNLFKDLIIKLKQYEN